MQKVANVWIENAFSDFEDEKARKEFLQLPKTYNRTKDAVDDKGNVVFLPNGKPQQVADPEMVDANTFLVIRHIATVAMNLAPINERTGRLEHGKDDAKFAHRAAKELKKLNSPDAPIVTLEEDTYKWILRMAEERGNMVFQAATEAVLEALKNVVKDESDLPKIVQMPKRKESPAPVSPETASV